jgi:hypothetical protein
VRYEELVRDTEAVVGRVCAALDLAPDPAMRRHFERAGSLDEHEGRIGRWRSVMDAGERAEFHLVAGELLADLGYGLGGIRGASPLRSNRVSGKKRRCARAERRTVGP